MAWSIYEIIHMWTAVVDQSEEWSSHMNYFIYASRHFTPHGRYELNKLTSLPMCGFIAQLVEHRTGIAEVTGSNPVEALIFFFRLLLSNCLNWKIYCDDHSSLWSTTAVHIWIISYMLHAKKVCMTTEHNFLNVISKEDALLYQTAANLLKDSISDSIPTSCNNQHLLRLCYLLRMIEVVRIAKSIRLNELLRFPAVRKSLRKTRNIIPDVYLAKINKHLHSRPQSSSLLRMTDGVSPAVTW